MGQDVEKEKQKEEKELALAAMRYKQAELKEQMKAIRTGSVNLQLPYYQPNIQQLTNGYTNALITKKTKII
jgi:hypothetical protein